jgi:hypothetical protein
LSDPSAAAALASQLGVSTAAASSALEQIGALSRTQGVDPASAAFAAIAHHLGVSPTRLAAALPLVKQAERAATPASKTPGWSDLSALASSAGITESQLEAGLVAAKQAGGNNPSAVAGLARATGVSPAIAQRIVSSVFGAPTNPNMTGPSAVAALATQLGVSTLAANSALEQIGALSRTQGVDPASAAFAAIAHHLGVSPTRLAAALPLVKQAERAAAG